MELVLGGVEGGMPRVACTVASGDRGSESAEHMKSINPWRYYLPAL